MNIGRVALHLAPLIGLVCGCTSAEDSGKITYLVDEIYLSETPPLTVSYNGSRTDIYTIDKGNRRSVRIQFPGQSTGSY